jgi:hypothetical protein
MKEGGIWSTPIPYNFYVTRDSQQVGHEWMDIKRKTRDIQTWEKKPFISHHILHQH